MTPPAPRETAQFNIGISAMPGDPFFSLFESHIDRKSEYIVP